MAITQEVVTIVDEGESADAERKRHTGSGSAAGRWNSAADWIHKHKVVVLTRERNDKYFKEY